MLHYNDFSERLVTPDGGQRFNENNALTCPTPSTPVIENIGDFRGLSNRISAPDDLKSRAETATALCHAIAACDPDDACQLITAALVDLSEGMPLPMLLDAAEDAAWWASMASPVDLMALLGPALEAVASKALHLEMRKRLFLSLWRGFGAGERARFLAWATEGERA